MNVRYNGGGFRNNFDWVDAKWKASVLMHLNEMAYANLKEGVWTINGEDMMVSPSEHACMLFDDLALNDILKSGAVFSGKTRMALKRLHDRMDLVDFEQPLEQLLRSSEWRDIQELAVLAIKEVEGE